MEYNSHTEVVIMKLPNAVIKVHIPNLTEAEKKLRLSLIEKASIGVLSKGD